MCADPVILYHFNPVIRHYSCQKGMSDYDIYVSLLLCIQKGKHYCWVLVITAIYFNALHQEIIWFPFKVKLNTAS